MAALDTRHVDHAGRTAKQRATGENEFWKRLPPAFCYRSRPIRDTLAAFERWRDRRMRLVALELLIGSQVRIGIVEVHHEADCHQIVAVVVEERAAPGFGIERPTKRVLDKAGAVFFRRNFPKLFHAEAEFLRLAVAVKGEFLDELLRERTA